MTQYIIYGKYSDGVDLINQINECKGFGSSNSTTSTYTENPEEIIDKNTDNLVGYGVPIFNWIKDCLTEDQINQITLLNEEDYIIVYSGQNI